MPDTAATMADILTRYRTVAVVGLSPKSHRDSFEVAQYMQAHGWRIIPINPNASASEILGETVYPSLQAAAALHPIDLVNVFRNSADVPPVVDDAIAVGAKAIWMQLGIAHEEAAQLARDAGLAVVQNKCLKVEHRSRQRGG